VIDRFHVVLVLEDSGELADGCLLLVDLTHDSPPLDTWGELAGRVYL
jgi:hypothetical protein